MIGLDKRKKMSNSFSQESIQSNNENNNNEETLFKNKLLMQTLEKSSENIRNNNEQKSNNLLEDKNQKLRDELNEVLAKRKLIDEKMQNEQNQLEKLTKTEKGSHYI